MEFKQITDIRPLELVTHTNYKRNGIHQGRAKEIEILQQTNGCKSYIVRHMNFEYTDDSYDSIRHETIIESRLYDDEEEAYRNLNSKRNLVKGYKEYDWTF